MCVCEYVCVCMSVCVFMCDAKSHSASRLNWIVGLLCSELLKLLIFWMVTCFSFSERGRGSAAALSVNALYFQHEGTHCHVTAGWSEPNSIKITEIPLNTSVLELELVSDTCLLMF